MAKDAAAAERPKPKKMGSAKVKGLFSKFVKTLSKKEKKAVPATATSTTPVVWWVRVPGGGHRACKLILFVWCVTVQIQRQRRRYRLVSRRNRWLM